MNDNPHRRRTDAWFIKPIKLSFIVITVIFFLVLVGFGKVILDVRHNSDQVRHVSLTTVKLVHENRQRIIEIQKSRVESCERTYKGIRNVFLTFFPDPPKRTRQQKNTLKKFDASINKLVVKCIQQTKPKSIRKGGNN